MGSMSISTISSALLSGMRRARFAVDTNADFHFIFCRSKVGLPRAVRCRSQRHTHAAAHILNFIADFDNFFQRAALFGSSADHFFRKT
jgi:hypothetical protein